MSHDTAFSRDLGHKVELRGLAPAELADALDALAMARGLDRHGYILSVLDAHVRRELHTVSVVTRALRGNPLLTEAGGSRSEG